MPQASIDPVVMAAAVVMRLQGIVSREVAATAALAGAGVVVAGSLLDIPSMWATVSSRDGVYVGGKRLNRTFALDRELASIANAEAFLSASFE